MRRDRGRLSDQIHGLGTLAMALLGCSPASQPSDSSNSDATLGVADTSTATHTTAPLPLPRSSWSLDGFTVKSTQPVWQLGWPSDNPLVALHPTGLVVAQARSVEGSLQLRLGCIDFDGGEPKTTTFDVPGLALESLTVVAPGQAVAFGEVVSGAGDAQNPDPTKYWRASIDVGTCNATVQSLPMPTGTWFISATAMGSDAHAVLTGYDIPGVPGPLDGLRLIGHGALEGAVADIYPVAQTATLGHRLDSWWRLLQGTTRLYAVGADQVVGDDAPAAKPFGVWVGGFDGKLQRVVAARLPQLEGQAYDAEPLDADGLLVAWRPEGDESGLVRAVAAYDGALHQRWRRDLIDVSVGVCVPQLVAGASHPSAFVLAGTNSGAAVSGHIARWDTWGGEVVKLGPISARCGLLLGDVADHYASVAWLDADKLEVRVLDPWGNPADAPACPAECASDDPCAVSDCVEGACRVVPRAEGAACGPGMRCKGGSCTTAP